MASFQKSETLRAAVTIALLSVGMASILNFLKLMPGQAKQPSIYKLIYTVPPSHLAVTKQAIFAVGGGTYDNSKYKNTTFESRGMGVFTPDGNANPNIGQVGVEEKVEEIRVEVRCEGMNVARKSVEA